MNTAWITSIHTNTATNEAHKTENLPLAFAKEYDILFEYEPKWRNWQTQRTQNPPPARAYGFKSRLRHTKTLRVVILVRSFLQLRMK